MDFNKVALVALLLSGFGFVAFLSEFAEILLASLNGIYGG